jgi:hypothetical protein
MLASEGSTPASFAAALSSNAYDGGRRSSHTPTLGSPRNASMRLASRMYSRLSGVVTLSDPNSPTSSA